jgi:hypothetical protein
MSAHLCIAVGVTIAVLALVVVAEWATTRGPM